MNQKKIIHIHSDAKFIQEIYLYSTVEFNNQLVFLGESDQLPGNLDNSAIFLSNKNKNSLAELIKICATADIIVLNNLSSLTIDLALKVSSNVKILWRFFGWELYSKHPDLIYSELSLKTWSSEEKKLSIYNQLKFHAHKVLKSNQNFLNALKRIDYFMGLMDDEYIFLKKLGYNLPEFRQVPQFNFASSDMRFEKSELIVFGNSRNRANNHLDILKVLRENHLPDKLAIKMFFNYGGDGEYAKQVRKEGKAIKQIELIENFLTGDEFYSIYQSASTLILNTYRQMAMGNIFTAIAMGVKIYLSEKNVAYNWFLKNNIKVFSIENELESHLQTFNLTLTEVETTDNIVSLSNYFEKCSIEGHNEWLMKICNESDI